jgi:mercuric ion transport protein
MDTTNTTKAISPVRGTLTYFMGALAFLTCPCHLPVLLLLLSGTAAGSYLSQNLGIAFLLLLPVFLLSAFATWRLLDTSKSDRQQIPHHRSGDHPMA